METFRLLAIKQLNLHESDDRRKVDKIVECLKHDLVHLYCVLQLTLREQPLPSTKARCSVCPVEILAYYKKSDNTQGFMMASLDDSFRIVSVENVDG